MKISLFVTLFFLTLVLLAFINYRLNNEFKIETSWMALGLAPVVIWLVSTHQLSEFSGFGLAFKLNQAAAKEVSLESDGAAIEPKKILTGGKESVSKIDKYIRDRVEAITLDVGKQGYYYNPAIHEYLERLTPQPFFKYVLFVDYQDGSFKGMVGGKELLLSMQEDNLDIVGVVESGELDAIKGLNKVAISSTASKQKALQLMDDKSLSSLPVIGVDGQFIGIVEREKITSSIVAQLVASN